MLKIYVFSLVIAMVLNANAQSLLNITNIFGVGDNEFSIEFVHIANPGNSANGSGNGSVNYAFNLGKYEISREQILKANSAAGLGIVLQDLSSYGGNGPQRPATGLTWNSAARFVNYLNTSQGYQAAYKFTTSGASDNLTLWGEGEYSGTNQYRHKDAYYFLPSRDEWIKGGFGSPSGNWYNTPTGEIEPTPETSPSGGTSAGTVVFRKTFSSGPVDVNNAGGLSPYGTMAQGGNVWEMIETAIDGTNDSPTEHREMRGGSWFGTSIFATTASFTSPLNGGLDRGFRVASVPEPSSLSLLLAGRAVLAAARRRRLV